MKYILAQRVEEFYGAPSCEEETSADKALAALANLSAITGNNVKSDFFDAVQDIFLTEELFSHYPFEADLEKLWESAGGK